MSRRVWRITHRDYKDSAFTGEGAKLFGGRFNSEGIPLVYTSGSLSLTILEIFVQNNDRDYFKNCIFFYADLAEELIFKPDPKDFPADWNQVPHGQTSQQFGDKWISGRKSLVMQVPSVVVPVEFNFVINPHHPDFHHISYREFNLVAFDERLFV